MSENKEEYKEKFVCRDCGLVHETPLAPEDAKKDDWKLIVLSAAGIAAIILIWMWVFKWGVPLVKKLSES